MAIEERSESIAEKAISAFGYNPRLPEISPEAFFCGLLDEKDVVALFWLYYYHKHCRYCMI